MLHSSPPVSSSSKLRGTILLVDDESEILEILEKIVEPCVGTVRTAANGRDALEQVLEGHIDVVLSDINMPYMSGLQLLSEVRKAGLHTPFVIVSAFGDKKNLLEAIRLDATEFLDKPFENDRVVSVVTRAMELANALRDLDAFLDKQLQKQSVPESEMKSLRHAQKVILRMQDTKSSVSTASSKPSSNSSGNSPGA